MKKMPCISEISSQNLLSTIQISIDKLEESSLTKSNFKIHKLTLRRKFKIHTLKSKERE